MAQNRILELKEQEFNMQYQQLVFQHQQRQEEIQHAHIEQYQEFNKHWDSVLAKAQEEDQQELQQLEAHHTEQLQ